MFIYFLKHTQMHSMSIKVQCTHPKISHTGGIRTRGLVGTVVPSGAHTFRVRYIGRDCFLANKKKTR
jgi:hypothetical protein